MARKLIRLAVLALLGAGVGCSSVRRPEVRGVHVRIDRIDFTSVGVVFDVDVYNPYPVRLKTPKFRYGIDVSETPFMDSEQPTEIDLPASGVGTVPLPVVMEYSKLWSVIEKLRGASEIPYRLHGAVVVTALDNSWDVPVEHQGKLPMLRPPSFSSPRVRLGDVSMTSAKAFFDVDVRNPNACGIGMDKLAYTLVLGKIPVASIQAAPLGELAAQSSGKLALSGEITAASALLQLARGQSLGEPSLTCTGALQTPYGNIPLPAGLAGFGR